MAGKLLSENQLGKRFFLGIIFVNLLAQMAFWSYKYWSGQEYSAQQQRLEKHWEEVYSAVMKEPTCYSTSQTSSDLPGKTYSLSCHGISKMGTAEFEAALKKLSPGFVFLDIPLHSDAGIEKAFWFGENKEAVIFLNPNNKNILIHHYIDTK